jgi:hypothetical protein
MSDLEKTKALTIAEEIQQIYDTTEDGDCFPEMEEFHEKVAEKFDLVTNIQQHIRTHEHNANVPTHLATRGEGFWHDSTKEALYHFVDDSWRSETDGPITAAEAQIQLQLDQDLRATCEYCIEEGEVNEE